MTPLVSIIIPCHNAGRWLAATLESALAQTWSHCEVILIDDGSTDNSHAVAAGFAPRGVRVARQPRRGASAARNHGLRLATGSYIQFLDADDLLAPDKIGLQLAHLLGRDDSLLAAGAWARFESDPAAARFTPCSNWRDLTGVEFLQLHYEEQIMMHPAAWLAPRSLLDRAGPWDETLTLNDDGEYFARVMLASKGIVFCPGARSYYRSNLSGSLSRRQDRAALESLYRSDERMIGYLLEADASERTRAAAAHAWKWLAFELYPHARDLSRQAMERSKALGGSRRPFPAGGRFQLGSRLLGWRLAKRLFC